MRRVFNLILIISILIMGFSLIVVAQELKEYDTNGDGKTDRWVWVVNNVFVSKIEMDLNFDGKVDAVFEYAIVETIQIPLFEKLDTDYDGVFDDFRYFKDGKFIKEELDTNNDGLIDIWIYVVDGYVYKIEKDTDFDGKIDEVINY